MDESIDEFKQNFQLIKEKKLKLAQISKYLSPSQSNNKTDSSSTTTSNPNVPKAKPSLSKLNETVKDVQAEAHAKSKSKLKTSKSTISNYFVSPKEPISKQISSSNLLTSTKISTDVFKCPLCSTNLTNLGEAERQKHVNECLDKDFSNKSSKNKFKLKDDTTNSNEKIVETNEGTSEDLEKDSSHMSTKVDILSQNAEERQKRLNENLLRDAVPNCPICGKVLLNMNSRQNHLKKCSQVFHIKTDALVELVKKQQEKLEKDLAKGLIPSDVYFIKPKVITKKEKITNRVLQLEQPVSKQEENLQAAIALSNSLNPAENCPSKAEIKLFKKSKKPINTPLTTTDEDTRLILLTTRLTSILDNKINYKSEKALETKSKKAPFVKTKFDSSRNYLWNRCSYFEETDEAFYVKIFLESGKFLVGHQLFVDKTNEEKFSSVELLNTQTAFLLADLNNQTQENISVFYTQLNQTQREQENQALSNFSFNPTQYYSEPECQEKEGQEEEIIKKTEDSDDILLSRHDTSNSNKQPVETVTIFLNKSELPSKNSDSIHEDTTLPISNSTRNTFLNKDTSSSETNDRIVTLANDIFENSADISMNSAKDVSNDGDICIVDDTLMSSSPTTSSSSSRINFTHGNLETDQNNSISLSKSSSHLDEENVFDKNIEYIDVTTSSNNSNSKQNESPADKVCTNNSESLIDLDGVEEKNGISNKLDSFSRKRKSIHIIDLDDNLDQIDGEQLKDKVDFKEENCCSKKFKIADTSNIICLEDDDEEYKQSKDLDSFNKLGSGKEHHNKSENESKRSLLNFSNKESDESIDVLECISFEKNSQLTEIKAIDKNKKELVVICSDSSNEKIEIPSKIDSNTNKDETYLNESKILMMLNQTEEKNFESNANQDEENEAALDEVWKNFDGNQFDDYGDYNNESFKGIDEMEHCIESKKDASDEELVDLVLKNPTDKGVADENEDSIDYDELEQVLNNVEENHAASQKQKSFTNTEKTPICLKNKNLIHVQNQREDLNMSALTPMPSYSSMDTPNLRDNLKKFGIKPLSKKQAVKKLVEIYEFTHKHKLQRSQSCSDLNAVKPTKEKEFVAPKQPKPVASDINLNYDLLSGDELILEQAAREMNLEKLSKPPRKKTLKKTVSDIGYQMNSGSASQQPTLLKIGVKAKKKPSQKELQECTLDEQMLEIIENDESDASDASPSFKGSQLNKKNKTLDMEETRQVASDLIKGDENLYLSILNYEPVDYENFLNRIQETAAPRKINQKFLMHILDEYCITFTLKNLNTRGGAKVKSKKKT